jgi:hypothetical protein
LSPPGRLHRGSSETSGFTTRFLDRRASPLRAGLSAAAFRKRLEPLGEGAFPTSIFRRSSKPLRPPSGQSWSPRSGAARSRSTPPAASRGFRPMNATRRRRAPGKLHVQIEFRPVPESPIEANLRRDVVLEMDALAKGALRFRISASSPYLTRMRFGGVHRLFIFISVRITHESRGGLCVSTNSRSLFHWKMNNRKPAGNSSSPNCGSGRRNRQTDEMGDRDSRIRSRSGTRGKYFLFTRNLDPSKLAVLDRTFRLNATSSSSSSFA